MFFAFLRQLLLEFDFMYNRYNGQPTMDEGVRSGELGILVVCG